MINNFKSSINTKFDIGKSEILVNYIPTSSHTPFIKAILSSSNLESAKNSHIIVGPYGTGKSFLTTLVCNLLSKSYSEKDCSVLINRFKQSGEYPEIVSLLNGLGTSRTTYIPILLNGNEGSFREAIISNIYKYIQSYNKNIQLPGIPNTIINIIQRWKNDFPNAYAHFLNLVTVEEEEFVAQILNHDSQRINEFNSIYSTITFGEALNIHSDTTNFIQAIEDILCLLMEQKLGILIAYDEFGRFLQTLSQDEIHRTMQDIQDLAELANNGASNFEFLLVSHKNLNSYFTGYGDDLSAEFRRIEGRFSTYTIKSDQNVFATLIKDRVSSANHFPLLDEDYCNSCISSLRIFDLFDTLTPTAIENLVIKGCYPLHPVTLFLLSVLSNIYGQNERTLFTFLDSEEKGGFQYFINNSAISKIIYPEYLFSYFFDNMELNNDLQIKLIKKNMQLLHSNFHDDEMTSLYTFISLWELAELNEKQRLTSDFISFSSGMDTKKVSSLFEKLSQSKFIRFNYRIDSWETFQGSTINLEKHISKTSSTTLFTNEQLISITSSLLPSQYIRAIEYNEEKQITRFAENRIVISDGKDLKNILQSQNTISDSQIIYVIRESSNIDLDIIKKQASNIASGRYIICLTTITADKLIPLAKRANSIRLLKNNDELINKDDNIKLELEYLLDEALYEIKNLIDPIINFSQSNYWFVNKDVVPVLNEYNLQSCISQNMRRLFPNTPIIANDLFNKSNISPAQKKAAITVIQKIMEREPCEGTGPDYLIYYSIFIKNEFSYCGKTSRGTSTLHKLKALLLEQLQKTNKLEEILDIFKDERYGYGIRTPIIPILFTGLLADVWDNLLFFNKESYLMNLDAEAAYEIFTNPSDITFKYHTYSKEQDKIIETIMSTFTVREEDKSKPRHIKAGNAIYYWLKNLPRYAQISFDIEESLTNFRDYINYFSIDPIKSLELLYTNYYSDIQTIKSTFEGFVKSKCKHVTEFLLSEINIKSLEELFGIINNSSSLIKLTNTLADVVEEAQFANEYDFIEACSNKLIGISVEAWSDNTKEVFQREFLKYSMMIMNNEYVLENSIIIEIDGKKNIINKAENLSIQAENLLARLDAMINAQNSRVTSDEIDYLLYSLLRKRIK